MTSEALRERAREIMEEVSAVLWPLDTTIISKSLQEPGNRRGQISRWKASLCEIQTFARLKADPRTQNRRKLLGVS